MKYLIFKEKNKKPKKQIGETHVYGAIIDRHWDQNITENIKTTTNNQFIT